MNDKNLKNVSIVAKVKNFSNQERIKQIFLDSINTKQKVIESIIPNIEKAAEQLISCLQSGMKVLICGNGGSAADAQHFAAELICRFEKNRPALAAISLSTDTSNITATGNDFGFDTIFSRQVEALACEGDVLVAISTSGNSPNIISAIKAGLEKKMKVICLSGKDGGKIKNTEGVLNLIVPSANTGRIQESHITIIHTLCKLIEDEVFA